MSFEEAQVLQFAFAHQPFHKTTTLRIADVAEKRDAVSRSKLGAARVVIFLFNNVTKLKNKTTFKIA